MNQDEINRINRIEHFAQGHPEAVQAAERCERVRAARKVARDALNMTRDVLYLELEVRMLERDLEHAI